MIVLWYSVSFGIGKREFVGLDNYKELFKNTMFLLAVKNTCKYMLVTIPVTLGTALCISVILQQITKGQKIFRLSFLYPIIMPIASIVLVIQFFFKNNGFLNFDILILQVNMIRPWVDSLYNLILFIIKNKNLNIEQKMEHLEILKYSFLGEDWQILHSLGRLLNYNKVVEYLLDKGLFEKNEQIEKISEDKIQFIQNEMKLKGNPSLESCEIEL